MKEPFYTGFMFTAGGLSYLGIVYIVVNIIGKLIG